jgi:hypothetical protein
MSPFSILNILIFLVFYSARQERGREAGSVEASRCIRIWCVPEFKFICMICLYLFWSSGPPHLEHLTCAGRLTFFPFCGPPHLDRASPEQGANPILRPGRSLRGRRTPWAGPLARFLEPTKRSEQRGIDRPEEEDDCRPPPTSPETATTRLAAASPAEVRTGPRRRRDGAAGRDVADGGEEGTLRVVGAVVLGLWVRWS